MIANNFRIFSLLEVFKMNLLKSREINTKQSHNWIFIKKTNTKFLIS